MGFSFFSTKKFFLLNENYEIDFEGLENFLHENRNQKIFIYGFTFVLWKYFVNDLIKKKYLTILKIVSLYMEGVGKSLLILTSLIKNSNK